MALFDIKPKNLGPMTSPQFSQLKQSSEGFSQETEDVGVANDEQFAKFKQGLSNTFSNKSMDIGVKSPEQFESMKVQVESGIPTPQQSFKINTPKAFQALSGHESRGIASKPESTINPSTGATGVTQLTLPMFQEWQNKYAKDKKFAQGIRFSQIKNNAQLQQRISNEAIEGINSKYSTGLSDWPTSTARLKKYKEEIHRDFNHPIYWLAGEWVAGPDWVSKLDNPTAYGAKETVRDYMKSVGERYFNQ